eukprot:CAMPEP_0177635566 /NCGR_PEP_ID=MMETSP0447-20121125/3972_1 /TAXON_ID=0 /ORGANISM="Stygamoeba regulata, Strain BSH-02190019" /LENGTH=188 /DNA_ID=CAMNT_0019137367 /DNA_START=39 /DNA_END=602 /DNA_ORIENTATION=+
MTTERNKNVLKMLVAVVVGGVGLSYASVPLYRVFCQVSGYGGTTQRKSVKDLQNIAHKESKRKFRIHFDSGVNSGLPWAFKPLQHDITLRPGETALAFYNATNNSDNDIIGVSSYNVTPFKAGPYFNKIQCFCFEEQKLSAHESVDMPVFFYLDPEIEDDPSLKNVKQLTLSYTFFRSKEKDVETLLQ